MNMLADIEDVSTKLKVLKALMSDYLNNQEVVDLLQQEIDKLEAEKEEGSDSIDTDDTSRDTSIFDDLGSSDTSSESSPSTDIIDELNNPEEPESTETEEPATLPAPNELGIDFTDSSNFEQ